MKFVHPVRFLKLELLAIAVLLFGAVLFASGPTREFILESAIEQQYHDLENYRRVSVSMQSAKLTDKDLKYLKAVLEVLLENNPNFIFKDDVKLLQAKVLKRMGETSKSSAILSDIVKNSGDALARIDAVMEQAKGLEIQGQEKKAVAIIESVRGLSPYYKKDEIAFTLARYYTDIGNKKGAANAVIQMSHVREDQKYFYEKIIKDYWGNYSLNDKKSLLTSLSAMGSYETAAVLAKKYINNNHPSASETESIALDLVYHSRSSAVKSLIDELALIPDYQAVYLEMNDLYYMYTDNIRSSSGAVRGSYFYRMLKPFDHKARYSAQKVLTNYQKYLSGDMDIGYARKNLQVTIRNLLAFKKYNEITNIITQTEESLLLNPETGVIGDDISFWKGYSCMVLGDTDEALHTFEGSVSDIPDGYYAIQARQSIRQILSNQNLSEAEYTSSLQKKMNESTDFRTQLYYARILYPFKKGLEREDLRKKVILLTKKFNDHVFFDFDDAVLDRLKTGDGYARFAAHARFGLLEKARAILSSADISDPTTQNLLILRELIRNKDFRKAQDLFTDLSHDSFLNKNFAFFSRDIQQLLYPKPYDSEIRLAMSKLDSADVDPYLIYSVIRGESMYMPNDHSHVGARGLMQLMPATARLISPKIFKTRDVNLYNPANNIVLGTVFLDDSIKSYGFLSAIASYNGGIAILKKTQRKFAPRNELELMEILPYLETREYVKKILSGYYRYQSIYQHDEWNAEAKIIQKQIS